jgi:hypothetical protein
MSVHPGIANQATYDIMFPKLNKGINSYMVLDPSNGSPIVMIPQEVSLKECHSSGVVSALASPQAFVSSSLRLIEASHSK